MGKRKLLIGMLAAAFLLSGFLFAGSMVLKADEPGPVLLAARDNEAEEEEEIESEDDFWSIFRGLFMADEPEYEDQVKHTEVAGVRGIEREGKMESVYDWESVRWMEEFRVEPEQVKGFLESGELGPYSRKGKAKEKES